MEVLVRRSPKKAAKICSQVLLGTMYQDRRINISLAPGATAKAAYRPVTRELRKHSSDFTNVHFYSYDNVDVDNHADGLTGRDLRRDFFNPGRVPESQIHLINVDNHSAMMDQLAGEGGLDLFFLSLGPDGHFCGNMPGKTDFQSLSYLIPAPEIFNETVGLLHLLDGSAVPEFAVTMGPAALLESKRLLMLVTGEVKAEAVRRLVHSRFDPAFPATRLRDHANFTLVLDEEAAALL